MKIKFGAIARVNRTLVTFRGGLWMLLCWGWSTGLQRCGSRISKHYDVLLTHFEMDCRTLWCHPLALTEQLP